MRQFLKIAVGVAAVAGFASAASAGTATSPIAVTASVAAACSINTTALAFGAYTGAVSDANATVTANCVSGTAWTISLGTGNGAGATTAIRKLTSGANTINYQLYSDAGHTTNWGNTVGTDVVTGTGTGGNQANTVYGRIASGLSPASGSYTDSVVATITF
jgi:spore coat protein U-like protein